MENAFTLFGVETPEQVRARIGKAEEQERLGRANSLFSTNVGRQAYMAGGNLANALGGAFGNQKVNPEVARAQRLQGVFAGIDREDFGNPKSYMDMAQRLADAGEYDMAMKAQAQGLAVEKHNAAINLSKAKADAEGDDKGGSSEFERLTNKIASGAKVTSAELSRYKFLAALKGRPSGEDVQQRHEDNLDLRNQAQKLSKDKFAHDKYKTTDKRVQDMSKLHKEGAKHFKEMNTAIDGALAALEVGNNGVADKLLTQGMTQIKDSNVRAFAMYKEFDKTFGDVGERVWRSIGTFLSGKRTDAERAVIKDVLMKFQQNYAKPGEININKMFRGRARDNNLDPYRVVPPASPEEIRDDKSLSKERKLKLLENYFSDRF